MGAGPRSNNPARAFSTSAPRPKTKPHAKPSSHTPAKTPSPSHPSALPPGAPASLNFSQLKRVAASRAVPALAEADLVERFVRGSGPGGQSINKTENCVQLTHVPTGLRVECQDTRSLIQNRKIARKWLLQKVGLLSLVERQR